MNRSIFLALLCLAGCATEPNSTLPPPTYTFADSYTCTLNGTMTITPMGGSPVVVDMLAAQYTFVVKTGDVTTPSFTIPAGVANPGDTSGTVLLVYDPQDLAEGAIASLTHLGAGALDYWTVATDGTLTELSVSGTCTPNGGI